MIWCSKSFNNLIFNKERLNNLQGSRRLEYLYFLQFTAFTQAVIKALPMAPSFLWCYQHRDLRISTEGLVSIRNRWSRATLGCRTTGCTLKRQCWKEKGLTHTGRNGRNLDFTGQKQITQYESFIYVSEHEAVHDTDHILWPLCPIK